MSELQLLNKLMERKYTPAEQRGIDLAKAKIRSATYCENGSLRTDSDCVYWLQDMLTRACIDLELYREKLGELQKGKL